MQKQSFQRFPIRYRPYDFPARFPVLAFLGENWTISVDSPEYLHFHNGLEIGHCIRGNGQVFMTGRSPSVYETGTFSILFPQVPHMAVCGTQESQWEYIYIDPIRFLESAADCGSDIWQIFYMLQEIPVIIQEDTDFSGIPRKKASVSAGCPWSSILFVFRNKPYHSRGFGGAYSGIRGWVFLYPQCPYLYIWAL